VGPLRREDVMPSLEEQIKEKKRKLQELIRSRSQATCASVVSTEIDVRRETEIEELEEQIRELQGKLKR
jgi:polyhydroxyalkanoate synthesis regulator phasin